ncbi:MAG: hypothetical protein HKN23_09075 [Verrucomicrobiales bacterium]|nr:hypothetical protein [Verrucomicrobiales bacterium]
MPGLISRKRLHPLGFSVLAVAIGSFAFVQKERTEARQFHLPAMFSDHMVLQEKTLAKVWGKARPGRKIRISADWKGFEEPVSAVADESGNWHAFIETPAAGGPYELRVGRGKIRDVMVGQVWLAAGQSNMQMSLSAAEDAEKEIAKADHPEIRFFKVKRIPQAQPAGFCEGEWIVCTPETAPKQSAVSYFFAETLQRELGNETPVGVLVSAWGSTAIESWIPRPELEKIAPDRSVFEYHDSLSAQPYDPETAFAEYESAMADWLENPLRESGRKKLKPQKPLPHAQHQSRPGNLFNGMIHPLAPYSVAGAIWYQGESNTALAPAEPVCYPAENYGRFLCTLFECWSKCWELPQQERRLPFLVVQLPRIGDRIDHPGVAAEKSGWAVVRAGQQSAAGAFPDSVRLISTIDLPIESRGDIHPKAKRPVGERLALAALRSVYGRDLTACGPIPSRAVREGNSIRLLFSETGHGLAILDDAEVIGGFTLAPENGIFHRATARIEGETVLVESKYCPHPVFVRYGWEDHPACNLGNRNGFSTAPFVRRISGKTN